MTSTTSSDKKKRKKSSVRHTRAIQVDRFKQPIADNLPGHVEMLFRELVHPLTMAQSSHFHQLGLRERTLTLSVMMAAFLMAVWRQIASVSELARLIRDEAAIWEMPVKVSQQALSQRLRTLPPQLALNVLNDLLPIMQARWESRQRPLPPELVRIPVKTISDSVSCRCRLGDPSVHHFRTMAITVTAVALACKS